MSQLGLQPEVLPEVTAGVAQSSGSDRSTIRTEGVPANSATLSGSKFNCLLIRGYRYLQPPATISQPYGLPLGRRSGASKLHIVSKGFCFRLCLN